MHNPVLSKKSLQTNILHRRLTSRRARGPLCNRSLPRAKQTRRRGLRI